MGTWHRSGAPTSGSGGAACRRVNGAEATRTPNFQLAKLALYQLSYRPGGCKRRRRRALRTAIDCVMRVFVLIAVLFIGGVCTGQDEPAPEPPVAPVSELTAAEVQAIADMFAARDDIEPAVRDRVKTDLEGAIALLQRRDAAKAEAAAFASETERAPGMIEEYRAELAQAPAQVVIEGLDTWTSDQVREAIETASAELDLARSELAALQAEATRRTTRLDELPRQVQAARERLAAMPVVTVPPPDAPPADRSAAVLKIADRTLSDALLARDEAELASYRARRDLLPLRRDRAQRRVDRGVKRLELLQNAEATLQRADAQRSQRDAARLQRQAGDLSPSLKAITEELSALAAERSANPGVISDLTAVRERQLTAQGELASLRDRITLTSAKVRAAGLSDAVGLVLRTELGALPDAGDLHDERRALQRRLADAQYRLIVVEESLSSASDIEALGPPLVAEARAANPDMAEEEVNKLVRDLLANRADQLRTLRSDYLSLVSAAADLDTVLGELLGLSREYRSYIEERILWTQSVPRGRVPTFDQIRSGVLWLVDGSAWTAALTSSVRGLWPIRTSEALVLALASLVLLFGKRARKVAADATARTKRFQTDNVGLTFVAVACTFVRAMFLPALAMIASILFAGGQGEHAAAASAALRNVAALLAGLEFMRRSAVPGGIADVHFRWPKDGLAYFRRWVFRFELVSVPLALLFVLYKEQPNDLWNDAIGRATFILLMLSLAAFFGVTFAPWRPFVQLHLRKRADSLANRTRWVWYVGFIALPVTLAVAAVMGYYYTAVQLELRLKYSIWLVVITAIAHALAMRWLFIERRRLLVAVAKQRRTAAQSGEGTNVGEAVMDAEASVDVPDLDAQSRRVLRGAVLALAVVGLYVLWADILPALRMLERVQVWPQVTVVELREETPVFEDVLVQSSAAATPESAASNSPGLANPAAALSSEHEPSAPIGAVTLADVGLAIVVAVLTIVLARNFPGMLELVLLKRLPLDAGSRFAVTAILRYVIAVVGILLTFNSLGIGWSQVQWLVAALTFGLAFGLQEIFANFISGLIILIERPIRVGDAVTVDGTTGSVTQIRMRATTVRDWELRELLVPNKVFITDRFINWTLSDPRIRITIPVGVSYGSDVRLVERTLLELGRTEPHVLTEPAPRALFVGFGDSTLNFELRVFLEHFDHFINARSNLHTRVIERFRELGIEIAFPQLDLHVRSADALRESFLASRAPTV